jgi:DNA invertase Pin-like site-specific DNA recombinase
MSVFPDVLAGPKRRGKSVADLVGIMYLRASKDRLGRSISVADQRDEGIEWFEEIGIRLHAVHSDNNLSASLHAKHDGRDAYERALDDLRSGRANLLWTFDHSRAQRDLEVYTRLRRICIETGALWAYGGRIYDMTDPKDRKDTARDAVDAEGTADNISIHTVRGIKGRAKRGEHAGPVAYGYRPIYDPDTGKSRGWVIVDEEKAVIRRIVDWCLERKSLKWIAATLNAEGVPCPRDRRWNKRLVVNLAEEQRHAEQWAALLESLTPAQRELVTTVAERVHAGENPTEIGRDLNRREVPYFRPSLWDGTKVKNIALSPPSAGLRRHRKQIVMRREPDADAPEGFRLVPVETTWEGIKTHEEHAKLVALLTNPERRKNRDGDRVKHQWSGIARCGVCGSRTTSVPDNGKARYRCYERSCVTRDQGLVDAWLTEQAIMLLEREDAAQLFRLDQDVSDASAAQREAAELRAQLDGFRAQALSKKITAESFAFFEADLLPKIEKADERAKRATLPPVLADVVGANARAALLALDVAQQREIFRAIMRPRILPTKRKARGKLDTDAIDPGFLYTIPAPEPEDESAAA